MLSGDVPYFCEFDRHFQTTDHQGWESALSMVNPFDSASLSGNLVFNLDLK